MKNGVRRNGELRFLLARNSERISGMLRDKKSYLLENWDALLAFLRPY